MASKERGMVVSRPFGGCPQVRKLASAGPGAERTAPSDGQRGGVSALGPRVPEEPGHRGEW